MTARDEILRRIREALPGDPADPRSSYKQIKSSYTRASSLPQEQTLALLIDRLLDYETEIAQLPAAEGIPNAIAEALSHKGETSLLAAEAFPEAWLPQGTRIIRDTHLSTAELDAHSAVVTTCEAAIASTGTIVLVHTGAQGRRALTLLPDHHICLLRRDQVFETISEALAAVAAHSKLPLTTISGPSATSDIEMTRIRGVHGPRRLTVILYGARQRQSA